MFESEELDPLTSEGRKSSRAGGSRYPDLKSRSPPPHAWVIIGLYILYRVFVKFWVFRYRKSVKFKPMYRDSVKISHFGKFILFIAKWSKFVIFTVPVSQIRQNQGVFYCRIFVCSIANRSNSGFFLSNLDYFSLAP